jgi:endonuclease/exonuclease/phosphatase family metal-dependent hydrolase
VRVATYNVNYGRPGHVRTVAAIRALDADCLFLQETSPDWERALHALDHPVRRFRHWRPGRAGGHALLSRAAVLEEEILDAPTGWFPAWRVVVAAPGGPLQVLAVHLRPWFSVGQGFHRSFLSTQLVRRLEIETHHARLDPKISTIILGDFNEADGSALRFLRERGYRQLDASAPTWRLWRWRRTFDHVFVGPGVAAYDVAVVDAGASDHLPLACGVRLNP